MKFMMTAFVLMSLVGISARAQQTAEAADKYMTVCGSPAVQPCAAPAKALKIVQPSYSNEARAAKFEGVVILKVLVGLNGRAQDVIVLKGPGLGLEAQAIKAVKKWKFQPATFEDKPVVAWQIVELDFRLY